MNFERVVLGVEILGVAILVLGTAYTFLSFLHSVARREVRFDPLRVNLGKSILLGLEVLIVADIIATVAIRPTLGDLYVLGLIVLIRTFLSFALEIEISGRLPWRRDGERRGPEVERGAHPDRSIKDEARSDERQGT